MSQETGEMHKLNEEAKWGVGATPHEYGNPHNVKAEADLSCEPQTHIPRWGETRFVSAFSPSSGAGIFYHAGRHRGDLDLWFAHIASFLPDGEVVVDRSSGRYAGLDGMATGNFRLKIEEPLRRFSMQFDGGAERTTTLALANHPGGSGARYVPMAWDIQCDAVGPVWDLFAIPGISQSSIGSVHTQQGFRTAGHITVAGKSYNLDGVGVNDHSNGPRDFDPLGGNNFIVAVLPGMTLHLVDIWKPDRSPLLFAGSIFTRQGPVALTAAEMPPLEDLLGRPHAFALRLLKSDGSAVTFKVEILHTIQVTVNDGGDNMNGVEWNISVNPYVATECLAKFTGPDGIVGYGQVERSARRDRISRESLRLIRDEAR
jgi:hypothetical protein